MRGAKKQRVRVGSLWGAGGNDRGFPGREGQLQQLRSYWGLVCHCKPWTYTGVPEGDDPWPRPSNHQGDSQVPTVGPVTCLSSSSPYRIAAGFASPVQTLQCYPLSEDHLGVP